MKKILWLLALCLPLLASAHHRAAHSTHRSAWSLDNLYADESLFQGYSYAYIYGWYNGNPIKLQADQNGDLIISPTGSATSSNITQWASATLGAPSNYGTSPGAVTVPAVNAYITNSPVLGAGAAIIGKVGIDQTTPGTTNGVQVNAALPAGTNLIGSVLSGVGTSGGVTTTYQNGALTNTVVSVKASAGNFYGWVVTNTDSSHVACFEVFNTASGSVSLGSTVPIAHITLNPLQTANWSLNVPITCGTAISCVAVTAYNGSTAPTTALDVTVLYN